VHPNGIAFAPNRARASTLGELRHHAPLRLLKCRRTRARNLVAAVKNPVTIGVALGLLIGKPFGITAFAWTAERLKLAARPAGVNWMQVFAASWVCGIGFTMSLFVATLALPKVHYWISQR